MFYRWVPSGCRPKYYVCVDVDPLTRNSLVVAFPLAPFVALWRMTWWVVVDWCYGARRRDSNLWQEGYAYARSLDNQAKRDEKFLLHWALLNCSCGAVKAVLEQEKKTLVKQAVEESSAIEKGD